MTMGFGWKQKREPLQGQKFQFKIGDSMEGYQTNKKTQSMCIWMMDVVANESFQQTDQKFEVEFKSTMRIMNKK